MKHAAKTADGTDVTAYLVERIVGEISAALLNACKEGSEARSLRLAAKFVLEMTTRPVLDDFLTTVAYPHIVEFSRCHL